MFCLNFEFITEKGRKNLYLKKTLRVNLEIMERVFIKGMATLFKAGFFKLWGNIGHLLKQSAFK